MRAVGIAIVLVLLPGCTSAGDSAEVDWIVNDLPDVTPTLDAAEAEAGLAEVLGMLVHFHGAPMFDVYDEVMRFSDPYCPGGQSDPEGGSLWDATCESTNGASFSGFVSVFRGMHPPNYDQNMRGEATVVLPDGRTWIIAGQVNTSRNESRPEYSTHVDGVHHWSGEASEGAVLTDGWEVSLDWAAAFGESGELGSISVDGSVSVPEGSLTAVAFGTTYFSRGPELGCDAEPAGGLALRDNAGAWHELVFDIEGDMTTGFAFDPAECDGCGTLWHGGVAGETVCIDTAPLFTAEEPPW